MSRTLAIDITGIRFGRLTAVREVDRDKWNKRQWEFVCDCGTVVVHDASRVKGGNTSSCGCLHKEMMRAKLTTHGMKRHGLYSTWQNMKERCRNPRNKHYYRYGGRGIGVCDRWEKSFPNFVEDMGERPSSQHSLDRIDNDGNYEPGNCRWATGIQQCRNTRRNRILTFNGKTMTLPEWAEATGIPYVRLASRIQKGWSAERALTVLIDGRTARWK